MSGLLDYSVVYFGNDWFAENRTSSHHIARRLGKMVYRRKGVGGTAELSTMIEKVAL